MSSNDYYMNYYYDNMHNCSVDLECWNNTYNYTWVEIQYEDITFWQIPQLVILVILFIFIVFGNTCVLVAIGLSETGRKTRMNFFILNLAIADLTVGIFYVTVDIVEKCLITWYGGAALCKIIRFLQVVVMYASTFMLVSLSIDRVDAIARPMNFTRKAVTVRALVYAAWITSVLFAFPSLLLNDAREIDEHMQCIITVFPDRWHWQLYITLVALSTFVFPALIIAICYTIILFVIWDKGRVFTNAFRGQSFRNLPSNVTRHREMGNAGIIPQAKIRTIKMTLIIVVMFVLCWCPYFVYNLYDVYREPRRKTQTEYAITVLIQSLAPLNSAANPIIYGIFSTRICRNLRRIPCIASLFDMFCKCRLQIKQQSPKGGNQSTTEQTLLEGASTKANRRNASHPHTEQEVTTMLRQNGHTCTDSKGKSQNNPRDKGKGSKVKGLLYNRRPSGLPLVNRNMSEHDTLILQTYRDKLNRKTKATNSCQAFLPSKDLSTCSEDNIYDETKDETAEAPNSYL